jgi:hypothetical protein
VDEDFSPQSCATGELGICSAGTSSCQDGAQLCHALESPVTEICDDGLDNDCDGATDHPDDPSCTATSLSIPVAASEDDVEERVSSGGSISLTSNDLELTEDGALDQVVGLRFRNVGIPPGASILGARVRFTVDETQSVATSLIIEGEASSDAAPFADVDENVTSRARTQSAVAWTPLPWTGIGDAGPDQQTPELGALVQEIVDRPGWAAGNAMVFVIAGSGHRTAEAYDGVPERAAVLEVEYALACSSDADGDGYPCAVDCNDADASVHPEQVDACDGLDNDCDGAVDEDFSPESCATGELGICSAGTSSCQDGAQLCLALESPVTEVCDDGLDNDCDGATDYPDDPSCTATSLSIPVVASEDDVEERISSGGSISLTSNDLELTEDGALRQVLGLRFRNVAIPPGASIQSARIQFTADETHSVATSLTIEGEASDDAPLFVKVDQDVTSRPRTASAASWDPPPWTGIDDAGPDQRTPELSALVQEIVDRPGWTAGNAMVFVISGSGHRTAEAYDGVPERAALLEVEYLSSGP